MAILRSESFDAVSIGTALTDANTDFDNHLTSGTNSLTAQAGIKGAAACRYQGLTQEALRWDFAARSSLYARGYIRVDNAGGANQTFAWVNDTTDAIATRVAEVRFRSSNLDFQIRNNTATAVATSNAFALGDVIRWEWFVDRANTTQSLRLFTGANVDGTTPSQTITGSTGTGSTTFTRFNLGSQLVQSGSPVVLFDEVAIGDSWIGPYTPPVTSDYEFIEWNGSVATVLTAHEWNGSTLSPLETYEG